MGFEMMSSIDVGDLFGNGRCEDGWRRSGG